jgi:hypothetical protein
MLRVLPNTRWGWVRAIAVFAAAAGVAFWFWGLPALRLATYAPQEGDVLFQSLPNSDFIDAIEGITGSPYSHCGVVVRSGGKWMVVESIGTVHETPLYPWVQRGRASAFAAYRLTDDRRAQVPRFVVELREFLGRPYDFRVQMDDEFLYCSELIWKAWKNATGEEMGKLVTLGDLNWKPFEQTVRKYEQGPPPLDREMITPKDLSEAPQLRRVHRGGL